MPGGVLRRSNAHLGVSHRFPFKKSLSPSRRHSRQTGPVIRPMVPTVPRLDPLRSFHRPELTCLSPRSPATSRASPPKQTARVLAAAAPQYGTTTNWCCPLRAPMPPTAAHHASGKAGYTRRFFGGRQPLCGSGVTSSMLFTFIPAAVRAVMALSRPLPGPRTLTSRSFTPNFAAFSAAC